MNKRRKMRRTNPGLVVLLLALISAVLYFDRYVVEQLPVDIRPTATATRNPEALVQQAEQFYSDGNLFRAIETYQQAILADPDDSTTHVNLARVQVLAGQYEAAQTSAQNALLLSPSNPAAHAILGWSLSFLGDPLSAEQELLTALDLDSDNVEAHAYYSELLADQADYEGASEYSRRALELGPGSLAAHRARGYVLWLTGNYDDAIIQYQAALTINSAIADLHLSLGRVYWALDRNQDAIDEFNLADALNPGDPLPDTFISLIYLNIGEFAKSIQFASKATQDDPTNPRRYGNLGVAYYRNLQYADAIEAFTYAVHGGLTEEGQIVNGLELDYDVAHYFYMYGLALARSRRCSEALPVFQGLLAAVPGDEIAVYNADEGIRICQDAANQPLPAATAAATVVEDNVEMTPTPAP